MNYIQAAFLGIIQGLTEFLPISSSGHLVIMQYLMGIQNSELTFEVLVHFATLLAVIAIYRRDIIELLKKPFQHYNYLIIAGTIPTAIIGLSFEEQFEKMFSTVKIVGFMLIITGILLFIAEYLSRKNQFKSNSDNFNYLHAVVIGIGQGLAITPGISRSGITIALGLMLGLSRSSAAKYSFLLSIPAVLGATILKCRDLIILNEANLNLSSYLVGAVFAGISGYFAIKILLKILHSKKLSYFSIYCWTVGLLLLIFT
ncbi:MAG: Undecaprenyl-diphosphatase [Clostridia bacterium 41_269]|nr:MAG: Undecaprenyl-diphosphatase [Clostridia bacterium 41_269]